MLPSRRICLALLGALGLASAATVQVTPTTSYQTLDGFGGGAVYYTGWLTAHPSKQAMYDTLFTGLGLSYLRLGNWNQESTRSLAADSEIVAEGRKRLGQDRFKILMTSWGAPASLKGSGSVSGSSNGVMYNRRQNTLKKVNGKYVYAEFAQWWKQSLERYARMGIKPTVISFQNEPDMNASYEETLFDPSENDSTAGYAQALVYIADTLKTLSSKPLIYGPEVLGIGYNNFQRYTNALNKNLLDGYNYHLYHGSTGGAYVNPEGFAPALKSLAANYAGKPFMMSEYCPMRSAHPDSDMVVLSRLITTLFIDGNVSSYINWELLWGDGGQMVQVNNPWTTKTWSVNPEYHAMRHFSRFTGPGWKRIAASSDDAQVRAIAFRSADSDSVTLVLTNMATSAKSLNFSATGYGQLLDSWQSVVNGVKSKRLGLSGAASSLSLPAQSITTLVFKPSVTSSSSSAQVSSSSVKASSSSVQVSSSSAKASSSSVQVSSSSVKASSSSAQVSSSSTTASKCIAFVNGVGGYEKNCYKSGLNYMAAGQCYTMNPARGTAPAWVNNNANDTWWWSLASCSTGALAKVLASGSAQPSYYQLYDLQGKLHSTSAYVPQNLPAGRWLLISRDAQGQSLQSRILEVAP